MWHSLKILRMQIRMGTFEWKDVWNYLEGMGKLLLYFFFWFVPHPVFNRYEKRLLSVDEECLVRGYCKNCGCHTKGMLMTKQGCKSNCHG